MQTRMTGIVSQAQGNRLLLPAVKGGESKGIGHEYVTILMRHLKHQHSCHHLTYQSTGGPHHLSPHADVTIHTLTRNGVHSGLITTMETDMDNDMDIKEVSHSQF